MEKPTSINSGEANIILAKINIAPIEVISLPTNPITVDIIKSSQSKSMFPISLVILLLVSLIPFIPCITPLVKLPTESKYLLSKELIFNKL